MTRMSDYASLIEPTGSSRERHLLFHKALIQRMLPQILVKPVGFEGPAQADQPDIDNLVDTTTRRHMQLAEPIVTKHRIDHIVIIKRDMADRAHIGALLIQPCQIFFIFGFHAASSWAVGVQPRKSILPVTAAEIRAVRRSLSRFILMSDKLMA